MPRCCASEADEAETPEHDPHFDPIVSLPLVDIHTNEEDEEELVKIRARLYRYDTGDHEWKVQIINFDMVFLVLKLLFPVTHRFL